ncbi:MAG TPA: hypothetical protein VN740_06040 [Solirubrobacteraceae bacterium]|nr:hypothetical protein [Solirubrobacteraceae bacterium]
MSVRRRSAVRATIAGAAIAAAVLASAGAPAAGDVAAACGPAALTTLSSLDAAVANNIYRGELGGSETNVDIGHVTSAPDLLAAVAADNAVATMTAVKRIVYHPFWHIVRLRVLDPSGKLLADFGGPYVIAPVTGTLHAGGTVVGSFVMSVQDDVGFTKLENRAVGDPIAIYVGGRRVVELGADFPAVAPTGSSLALGGIQYGLVPLTFNAFPTGTLNALLAVPAPSLQLEAQSCALVSLAETARVVKRIARRFHPLAANYGNFVETVHADTGALVVVRIGLRVIAGSEGPGPAALPASGTVIYDGRYWSVFSFAPTPPARVFVLVQQSV